MSDLKKTSVFGIDWKSIKKTPPVNVSLLIRMDYGGPANNMIFYDVAIFVGIMKDGERRWILADITLNHKLITHWAHITEPMTE